jgi:hypothetical protein
MLLIGPQLMIPFQLKIFQSLLKKYYLSTSNIKILLLLLGNSICMALKKYDIPKAKMYI